MEFWNLWNIFLSQFDWHRLWCKGYFGLVDTGKLGGCNVKFWNGKSSLATYYYYKSQWKLCTWIPSNEKIHNNCLGLKYLIWLFITLLSKHKCSNRDAKYRSQEKARLKKIKLYHLTKFLMLQLFPTPMFTYFYLM